MKITNVTTTPIRIPTERAPYPTQGAGTKISWGRRSRLSPKRPEPMLEYLLVTIETDEGVTGIGESTVDIKLGKAGGFYGAKKIAALAEAAGLKCVLGTSFGLGIEIAAKTHLFASTQLVTDAVEFTELGLHGNLLKSPWAERLALPLEDGCLPVPDGAGLGVELDDEKVREFGLQNDTPLP